MKAVLLGEFTTDPEVAGTMLRMRSELSQLEATVKALQFEFDDPHLLTINAGDLLHLWRLQIAPLEAEARQISWSPPPVNQKLTLDPHAIVSVLRELVIAGWGRAPAGVLQAAVITTAQSVVVELREPISKTPPAEGELAGPRRLVDFHGGTLTLSEDVHTSERVIALCFAVGQSSLED